MVKCRITKATGSGDSYASATFTIDEVVIQGVEKNITTSPPAGLAAAATALKTVVQQITGES
jgi:hypothetical protein